MLIVAGAICSGKTTFAKKVAEGEKMKFIEVSGIVKEILKKEKRDDLQNHPELDKQIIEELKKHGDDIVVSGARQTSILEAFPDADLVWITCETSERFRRFRKRKDNKDTNKSLEAFNRGVKRDIELGLVEVKNYIQEKAVRDGTIDENIFCYSPNNF